MDKNKITELIKKELGDVDVKFSVVFKNNDAARNSCAISKKENDTISPIIYFDKNDSDENIADFIIGVYKKSEENPHTLSKKDTEGILKILTEKDAFLDNVIPVLINYEKNRKLFETIVYRPYINLAITYKVRVSEEGTVKVTKDMIDKLGITEDDLYYRAIENIKYEISDMPFFTGDDKGPLMKVLSTPDKLFGASAILAAAALYDVSDIYGPRFYILPSSIHEVICVPYNETSLESYKNMVKTVNMTELSEEEFLSDDVYICVKGKVAVA